MLSQGHRTCKWQSPHLTREPQKPKALWGWHGKSPLGRGWGHWNRKGGPVLTRGWAVSTTPALPTFGLLWQLSQGLLGDQKVKQKQGMRQGWCSQETDCQGVVPPPLL